jgi:hypothetical protein
MPRPQQRPILALACRTEPQIAWRYCERIEPGVYPAYSRSATVYRDGYFKRWVCAIQFDILGEALTEVLARLTWYLPLGSGTQPHAGRRGKYWAAWVKANGGPPERIDRLSKSAFVGRQAIVSVGYTTKNHLQITVTAEEGYSVVREVLNWETGGPSR